MVCPANAENAKYHREGSVIVVMPIVVKPCSAVRVPHYALFLDGPLAVLDHRTLVVGLLALGKRNLAFDQVALPVDAGNHRRITLLLRGSEQSRELLLVEEQFAGTVGFAYDMGAGRIERYDGTAQQPGFTILEHDVAVGELDFLLSHTFHLPSEQDHAGLETVFDEIVVESFLVAGNGIVGNIGFSWFCHSGALYPYSPWCIASALLESASSFLDQQTKQLRQKGFSCLHKVDRRVDNSARNWVLSWRRRDLLWAWVIWWHFRSRRQRMVARCSLWFASCLWCLFACRS